MNFVSNEYIYGGSSGNIGTGKWGVYFRLQTTGYNTRLMSKASGVNGWDMVIYSDQKIYFEINGSTTPVLGSAAAITSASYKDILFIWESGTLYIYVDGAINNSVVWTPTNPLTTAVDLWIGRSSVGTTGFTGSINDVRL